MTVELSPIADADVQAVAAFLDEEMDSALSAEEWVELISVPWTFERPNRGFKLTEDGRIVGAYLAFYSERAVNGRAERFCDLGTWCVRPEYRLHSLKLMQALLGQPGYHFTDLTPSEEVVQLNERFGFSWHGEKAAVIPNLPWPSLPGRGTVSSDPGVIERTLSGTDLQVYRDHAGTGRIRHVVLADGEETCHVVFRRDRRLGLSRALLLHVSNPRLYRRLARPLSRHLLFRHGILIQQVEPPVLERPPRPLLRVRSAPRMIRSEDGTPARVDYLYSEFARLSGIWLCSDLSVLPL